MAARVPLLAVRQASLRRAALATRYPPPTLLPTLVELAGGELDPHLALDGRSLVPHLQGQGGHDEVFGEYMAEGTSAH